MSDVLQVLDLHMGTLNIQALAPLNWDNAA